MSVTKVSSPMIEGGTKGADIASAATVVIGTDGSYFDITGTTGISTQFTVDAGRRFTLQFDGAVTITDNAAITLSGAANFTTAVGDILSFVAVAANTVVQTGYSLVDGGSPVAPSGGAWTLIGSSAASTSASLDQTGLDSTYDTYAIVLSDIVPTTDSALPAIRFGDSGGFDSGASDYAWHASYGDNTSGSYGGTISSGETFIRLGNSVGSAAGEGIGGVFFLSRPSDGTARPMLHGTFAGIGTSSGTPVFGGNLVAIRLAVITLDRVQFLFTSGNVGTGRMSVYGLAHA